jgi:hypothetical protein
MGPRSEAAPGGGWKGLGHADIRRVGMQSAQKSPPPKREG